MNKIMEELEIEELDRLNFELKQESDDIEGEQPALDIEVGADYSLSGEIHLNGLGDYYVICKRCETNEFNVFDMFVNHCISEHLALNKNKTKDEKQKFNNLELFNCKNEIPVQEDDDVYDDDASDFEEKLPVILDNFAETNISESGTPKKSTHSNCTKNILKNEPSIERKKFYNCRICSETFPTKEDIKLHRRKIHENRNRKYKILPEQELDKLMDIENCICTICSKTFACKSAILSHRQVHLRIVRKSLSHEDYGNIIDLEKLLCKICSKEFFKKSALINHSRVHMEKKPKILKPKIRKQKIVSEEELFTYIDVDRLFCSLCSKEYQNKSALISHSKTHLAEYKFKQECGFSTNNGKFRIEEGLVDIEETKKNLETTDSTKNNISSSLTESNFQTKEKTYECGFCGKILQKRCKWRAHVATHTDAKLECEICKKILKQKNFKIHMFFHDKRELKKCTLCTKSYHTKSSLNNHMKRHLGNLNYSCSYCPKKFLKSSEQKGHELVHTKAYENICEVCGKSFKNMRDHLKIHNEELPFDCSQCGKRFKRKQYLTEHLLVHTGQKFKCEVCDAKLSSRPALRKHRKLHSSVRQYICKICGKEYSQAPGLWAHMKTHGEPLI